MIKEEIMTINGKQFVKHTTDLKRFKLDENGKETDEELPCLIQVETNIEYFDTIDVYPCPYTYKEVDIESAK